MKSISLKNRILKYFKNNKDIWIHSAEIERKSMEIGKKGSNAGRRCRELVNENKLEKKEERGCVLYKYLSTAYKENTWYNKVHEETPQSKNIEEQSGRIIDASDYKKTSSLFAVQ